MGSDHSASDGFERLKLCHGKLEFSALALGQGPLVICLHGFPDHARSFRFQLAGLADAGYRVVVPTLRGYEPSSQPADGDYELGSIARDVVAWIDQLGARQAHLFGHDWGSAISYVAAAQSPERFLSLATLAVPHAGRFGRDAIRKLPSQLRNSWYMAFFQLRGIADWAVERNDWALVRKLWRDWSPSYALPEAEWRALVDTMSAPGVKAAMLGYYRQNLGSKAKAMQSLGVVPVPTLAMTGEQDGCIDTRLYDLLMLEEDFPAGLEVRRIEDAGHFAHLERPDQVNAWLIEWFGRHQAESGPPAAE